MTLKDFEQIMFSLGFIVNLKKKKKYFLFKQILLIELILRFKIVLGRNIIIVYL